MTSSNIDLRDAFFDQVFEIGRKDPDFVFISDDMDAFGLRKFKQSFPSQFINIGVAEQNMIDVAAGLAASGKRVFVFGICSYVTMRCFEQIKFSVCSMNLPVTIVGIGAGFSFEFDGPTHHGTQDLGIMRMLPEISIFNPSDWLSTAQSALLAYNQNKPGYIRLDKGTYPTIYENLKECREGLKIVRKLQKINVISTGIMTHKAVRVVDSMIDKGIKVGLVDIFLLKPTHKRLITFLESSTVVVSYEENSIIGGIGSIIADLITENHLETKLTKVAIPDKQYLNYGKREWFHKKTRIDIDTLYKTLSRLA